jgi:hypothetical protein
MYVNNSRLCCAVNVHQKSPFSVGSNLFTSQRDVGKLLNHVTYQDKIHHKFSFRVIIFLGSKLFRWGVYYLNRRKYEEKLQ